jgi:hypothetical protein
MQGDPRGLQLAGSDARRRVDLRRTSAERSERLLWRLGKSSRKSEHSSSGLDRARAEPYRSYCVHEK